MKFYYLLFILFGILFFAACGDDDDNSVAPVVESQIIMAPQQIAANDRDTITFYLSTQPKSSHTWQVTSKPKWLNLSQEEGKISENMIEIKGTINTEIVQTGHLSGILSIMSDGAGICSSQIEVYVNQYPDPVFEPESIHFNEQQMQQRLTIRNKGKGVLSGSIFSRNEWIVLSSNGLSIYPSDSRDITVYIDRSNQPLGTLEGELIMYYNNYEDSTKIKVTAEVPEIEQAVPGLDTLYFNINETTKSFYLKNVGNTQFNYSIGNESKALDCSPNSGSISVSDSVKIDVNAITSKLVSGVNNFNLEIKNSQNYTVSNLPVKVIHVDKSKWMIEGEVIDAEYNDKLEKLLILTADPHKLLICNTENKTMESIQINKTPKCLSVSPNGKYAVVGHNAAVSYLDLNNKTELGFYTVSVDCYDIVMSDRKWAYFTSSNSYNDGVFGLDLSTGLEKTQNGGSYYSQGMIKLDPTGQYLLTNQGSSSSNLYKYDVSTDSIKFLYSSNYGQNVNTGGDFWYSEDGERVFTKSKNVYRLSTSQEHDFKYAGVLEGTGTLNCVDHSSESNKICAAFATNDYYSPKLAEKLRIFDANYLNFEKEINLPKFSIPDGNNGYKFFKPDAKYCFFNSDGTKYIVVMQAEEGMPTLDTWAIYSNSLK